jgi:hypothetical protein
MNAPTPVAPATHPFDPRSWEVTRPDRASKGLATVLAVVAASAVYGGIGLMTTGIGMSQDMLAGTPFSSWTVPGLALLAFVALPQAVVAWLVAVCHRWAGLAAVVAGAGLVAWIGTEIVLVGQYFVLQPVVVVLGLAEIGLAAWWCGRDGAA